MSEFKFIINPNASEDEVESLKDMVLKLRSCIEQYMKWHAEQTKLTEDDQKNLIALFLFSMQLGEYYSNLNAQSMQITGAQAGEAIDNINKSTATIQAFIKRQEEYRNKVDKFVSVVEAIANFFGSILSKDPVNIIKNSKALYDELKPQNNKEASGAQNTSTQ